MPAFWGNLIVIAILGLVVVLAARYLYKKNKKGGGCNGNCGSCGGCH